MQDDDDYVETSDLDELELVSNPLKRGFHADDAGSKRVKLLHGYFSPTTTPTHGNPLIHHNDSHTICEPSTPSHEVVQDSQPIRYAKSVSPERSATLPGDSSDDEGNMPETSCTSSAEHLEELVVGTTSPMSLTLSSPIQSLTPPSIYPSTPIAKLSPASFSSSNAVPDFSFHASPPSPVIGTQSSIPAPPATSSSPRTLSWGDLDSSPCSSPLSFEPDAGFGDLTMSANNRAGSPAFPVSQQGLPVHPPSPPPHPDSHLSSSCQDNQLQATPAAQEPSISFQDHEHGGRYALRARQAKQIRPYAYDKLSYKQQMHGNPDAIVKIVSPDRQHRSRSRASEQAEHLVEEAAEGEWQPEDESQSREGFPQRAYPNVAILQDMSDPDSDPETRALVREGKKVRKERLAAEKEKRKLAAQQVVSLAKEGHAKRFPVPRHQSVSPPSTSRPPRRLFHKRSTSLRSPSPFLSPKHPEPYSIDEHQRHASSSYDAASPAFDNVSLHGDDAMNIDTPIEFIRNTRASPIDLTITDDGQSASESEDISNIPTGSTGRRYVEVSAKKFRHIMPAILVSKYEAAGQRKAPRPDHQTREAVQDTDGPLHPGQSRRHIAEIPRNVAIKGDSESSDEDPDGSQASSSQSGGDEHSLHHDVEVVSDDDDDIDQVDDEEIIECLNETFDRSGEAEEGDIIDWMVNRSRRVARPERKRRRKLDIMTSGARSKGRLRQTTLFEAASSRTSGISKKRPGFKLNYPTQAAHQTSIKQAMSKRVAGANFAGATALTIRASHVSSSSSRQPKRRRAERRRRGQTYQFKADGTRITSGRVNTMITIDLEDEAFCKATSTSSWVPPKRSPHKQNLEDGAHRSISRLGTPDREPSPSQRLHKTVFRSDPDFGGLRGLPSGRAFGTHSYLGKGWLFELIDLIANNSEPLAPPTYAFDELEIGVHLALKDFLLVLPPLCDKLFDSATGIPNEDSVQHSFLTTSMRTACQATSWYRKHDNDDAPSLQEAIANCVAELVTRLMHAELSRESLEPLTFSLSWFAIEMLARAGTRPIPTRGATDPFSAAVTLLISYLLKYGLPETMQVVLDSEHDLGDERELGDYTAELWICLLHVLNLYNDDQPRHDHGHLMWSYVASVMPNIVGRVQNVQLSETMWRTLLSLCTLSRFSVHGMSTSVCRLPPSWKLVHQALTSVNLIADPEVDQSLPEASIRKRDKYAGMIFLRFPLLIRDWGWVLDGASPVLAHIARVFSSRKFSNLSQEPGGFPSFMVNNDWSLLGEFHDDDTGFIIFLKLLVQMNKPSGNKQRLVPAVKKLISLAVPVGALPSNNADLSLLYNRYSAVAVALYLEPTNVKHRLSQAMNYVHIQDADKDTRIVCIRAAMYFALLLINLELTLVDWWPWVDDILKPLLAEYDQLTSKPRSSEVDIARSWVAMCLAVFLGSMQKIVDAFPNRSQYPDPLILVKIGLVAKGNLLADFDKLAHRFLLVLRSFLAVRNAVMPPPQRPLLTSAESQEDSQEYYGTFDLNLEDPELLAALEAGENDEENVRAVRTHQVQERTASEVMHVHIAPYLYRHMCRAFSKYDGEPVSTHAKQRLSLWIDCWVGCANVIVRGRKAEGSTINWTVFLNRRGDSWGRIQSLSLRCWVDMQIMLALLKVDPMEYPANQNRCIDILMECFATAKIGDEATFVSLMFSLDGLRHELLRRVASIDEISSNGDISLSAEQFTESRIAIFNAIIDGLCHILAREAHGLDHVASDGQQYIGSLISMYQVMKVELENLPEHERQTYVPWCQQVHDAIQQHAELRTQPRLAYWLNWGRNLVT